MGRWAQVLILGILGGLAVGWTFDLKLHLSGDDAEFMVLRESLENGHYRPMCDPQAAPSTKYPPGFPMLLRLVPSNLSAMKLLVVGCFGGVVALTYILWGFFPALFCAVHPLLLSYASAVMSEIPFALLMLAGIGAYRKRKAKNSGFWAWLLLGNVLLVLSCYVRTAGVAVIAGVLAYGIWQRKYRFVAFLTGCTMLGLAPWMLYLHANGGSAYTRALLWINPYRPELGTIGLAGLLWRIGSNVLKYGLEIGALFLPYAPKVLLGVPLVLVIVGVVLNRREIWVWALGAYMGLLLLWPPVWSCDRFLVPVVPFFGVLALETLKWGWRRREVPGKTLVLMFALMIAGFQLTGLREVSRAAQGGYPPGWRNYLTVGLWAKDHLSPESLIACRKPYDLYLVSGRHSILYPTVEPQEMMKMFEEKGVTHLLLDQLGFSSTERFLVPFVKTYGERLEVIHRRDNPTTLLLARR